MKFLTIYIVIISKDFPFFDKSKVSYPDSFFIFALDFLTFPRGSLFQHIPTE